MTSKEVREADDDILNVIEGGLIKYREALKYILQYEMEELYGGMKDYPKVNEGQYWEVWDKAVEECIKKVMEL